jgi:tetratricopeptide (TPR) repeat protein
VTLKKLVLLSVLVSGMALLSGCSLKKNTAASRNYQAFITRYNIYFNGIEHYNETLKEMENSYEDDFTTLLPMHPAEARTNPKAPQPSGSFTRSIEKAQKAIQLRSIKKRPQRTPGKSRNPEYREWLKREEYNPFIHNAWLLLAKSQYMDGDFLGAASTFMYIARHFGWLPDIVTEARIWQARSYCAAGWINEARATLDRIRPKSLTSKELRGMYAFADADICIASGKYDDATAPLRTAIENASGIQKTRLTFLLGQLLQRKKDYAGASEAFKKVNGSVSAPYRTRFNARIRQGATASEADADNELRAIRRMMRYERNKHYLDQIHYAEGNLLIAKGDTAGAVKAYSDAVNKSVRQGIDMAIANIALGEIYFTLGDYDKAQPCYSSSVTMLGEDFPNLKTIQLRSDVLDELAVHSRNVHMQDSLLRLADMSEPERLAAINRIIDELKKREEEERKEKERLLREEEEHASGSATQSGGSAQAPTSFTLNTDNSWYFYNRNVMTAGAAEFRRRWGGRKLEDNWRRRNKSDFAAMTDDTEDTPEASPADSTGTAHIDNAHTDAAQDPHSPEFYLKDIPQTEEQRSAAHAIIQEGLYNMGLILKDKLEDYAAAQKPWTRLLEQYPDNVYRLDTYYNMYLMFMRAGDMANAEKYRALITTEFAESPLGSAMTDPRYLENLKEMPKRQEELYELAYNEFIQNNNSAVRAAAREAKEKYPLSPLMPKFLFLEALTHVSDGNTSEFISSLHTLLEKYPDAEAAPLASAYIKGASSGRRLHTGGNNAANLWSTRLVSPENKTTEAVSDSITLDLNPELPQILMLTYPVDSVNANEILYEVARYNFNTFTIRDFDLEQMEFGGLGILLIKGFANIGEISRYMSMIDGPDGIEFSPDIVPIIISEDNFAVILRNGLSLNQYRKAYEDASTRGVHEAVLLPDEYPAEDEMYGDSTDTQTKTDENQ